MARFLDWRPPAGATLALVLAIGCGSATSEESPVPRNSAWKAITVTQVGEATVTFRKPAISLQSAALQNGVIKSGSTCREEEIWLPLAWGEVPPRTAELVLYMARIKRQSNGRSYRKAVSLLLGISPRANKLNTGAGPLGTYWIENPPGGMCREGWGDEYFVSVYALDMANKLDPSRLDLATLLNVPTAALASGSLMAVSSQ